MDSSQFFKTALETITTLPLSKLTRHFVHFNPSFQNALFSIGSAFLYYVNHFKLYSSFCASHSKAQKVLHPSKSSNNSPIANITHSTLKTLTDEGNQALQEFLAARNPKQQHSSTLESYLIKPIQRILKYPLLLQQLRNLTDPLCDEHQHLVGKSDRKCDRTVCIEPKSN